MFQLDRNEVNSLKLRGKSTNWGGRRTHPYAFTEHGVLKLSSIINSEKAIEVNIQLIRIFTRMREMLVTHKDILLQIEEMKRSMENRDERIDLIYNYLMEFVRKENPPRRKVGYNQKSDS